jgi:hypothetical protein
MPTESGYDFMARCGRRQGHTGGRVSCISDNKWSSQDLPHCCCNLPVPFAFPEPIAFPEEQKVAKVDLKSPREL